MKHFVSWMKRHGLCPCCLLEMLRDFSLSRSDKCKICAFFATILSALPLANACAEDRRDATHEPCETVEYLPMPSSLLGKLIGVKLPCPQELALNAMNANEGNKRMRLLGNPYANLSANPVVYKLR